MRESPDRRNRRPAAHPRDPGLPGGVGRAAGALVRLPGRAPRPDATMRELPETRPPLTRAAAPGLPQGDERATKGDVG